MNEFVRSAGVAFQPEARRATVLILDRRFDLLTPIMHDYYLQSMAQDLLDIGEDNMLRSDSLVLLQVHDSWYFQV